MTAPAPATAPTEPGGAPARGPRPFLVRYLLGSPFSVVIAAVVIAAGFVTGTFWGQVPQELAAGQLTTGQLAYWWTPLTALFVPDSIVDGVLSVVIALTLLAYAERLLGTVRVAIVFVVGGALGMLLGVGLEALVGAWSDAGGDALQFDVVLDPTTGMFAAILAASAVAPALFRRRIRVVGFTILLMFALYSGDSDSVYRLLAAVVGLVAGLMLPRTGRTGAWRRSSFQESRTLVAAIVAATGLGPVIVLLSGVAQGPLALAVSGFVPVDPDEVFARCAEDFSTQCDADIALALTAGVGPFLLSLVPVALSLVAAWGLRTGRRAAWILGLAVSAGTLVLTAIGLGGIELVDAAAIDQLGAIFYVAAVVALLVPIAVGVLLLVTARRFQVRAPRAATLRFWLRVFVAFVVLAVIHVVVGLFSSSDFLLPPTLGDLLVDAPRAFVPLGFLVGIPMAAIPVDGFTLIVFQWVGVLFWAVVIGAIFLLYRATRSTRDAAAEERFRTLLRDGGGGTLGFMGTWPGNDYWFTADGGGAVAYRVINGVALTMSDPVAPRGDGEAVIRGFVDFCDSQGWTAVFYSFHEQYLPVFESFGWQHMSVGEETVVPLPGLELTGKPWSKVRQAYNRGNREGLTTLWATWDELPVALTAQINGISEQWVSEKELPEMGFTLGGMAELKDRDVYLYLALAADGRVEAVTSWLPSWTDGRVTGWTIDFMRRGDESMSGVMEFVIASAALHMRDAGAEVLSLSGAPLATKPAEEDDEDDDAEPTVMTRLLAWLGGVLEPAYGFTSLFRFKSKFNPRYDTIYMAYADPAALPAIGLAIGKAYLPEVSPREYVALARTLTGGAK
jgi:phosphatidylglycerol lysyltransferase